MAAFGVKVQFGRDAGGFELEKPGGGVFDVDGVVFGLEEEGGRGVVGGAQVRVGAEDDAGFLVRLWNGGSEIAGVDDDGEVWAAGEFIGRVDIGVETLVEAGAEGGGEMAAGGEAEDADAVGVEVPLGCVGTDEGHRALRVFEGGV